MSQAAPARTVGPAVVIGSALEWYDFYLFASMAALVFGKVFFPGQSPVAGTLASIATFTVGFVVRPLSRILFGYLGDKIGRKRVLSRTFLLMGVSSGRRTSGRSASRWPAGGHCGGPGGRVALRPVRRRTGAAGRRGRDRADGVPFFWALNTGASFAIWAVLIASTGIIIPAMLAASGAYFGRQFPTGVRASGLGTGKETGPAETGRA